MSKRLLAVLAGAVALAAAITTGVAAQGQGNGVEQTLVVYEKGDKSFFKFVDAKPFSKLKHGFPKVVTPGDGFILRNPVFSDAAGTQQVGTLFAHCIATNRSRLPNRITSVCTGVFKLTAGDIALEGVTKLTDQTNTLAVSGGTAGYEGARGQVTVVSGANDDSTDTIHLLAK